MLGKDDSPISASITCLIWDLLLVFSEPHFPHLYTDAIRPNLQACWEDYKLYINIPWYWACRRLLSQLQLDDEGGGDSEEGGAETTN